MAFLKPLESCFGQRLLKHHQQVEVKLQVMEMTQFLLKI
jgi:hypothetical protein